MPTLALAWLSLFPYRIFPSGFLPAWEMIFSKSREVPCCSQLDLELIFRSWSLPTKLGSGISGLLKPSQACDPFPTQFPN